MTGRRLHRELRDLGYTGGYTILTDLLRDSKRVAGRPSQPVRGAQRLAARSGRQAAGLTLMEIRGCLAADKTFAASVSALWGFFDRHGISFKKTLHAAEQDREDVKAARAEWRERQPSIDPRQLVFIDETGTTTNMTRLRGRAPKGERLIGKTPHGHWKLSTFIAASALRHDRITAPMVIDGPMNGEISWPMC